MLYGIWEAVRTFFSNEFDECRPPFRIFVTKIGEKYDEREVGIRHQRRRLQFKRYSGAPRGRTQVRPGGRHCARNAAERYESGDNDQ